VTDHKKIENVYSPITERNLNYVLNKNGNQIAEFAHRLTGYVFEDNDDSLIQKECDNIDKFTWNNKSDKIRWAPLSEN
jgi:hypothetical protein